MSRFIGILEVVGKPFQDNSPIWKDEDFPSRLKVKPIIELTPETATPVLELKDRLSFFENLTSPHAWTGQFRGSPTKWKKSDGEAVTEALHEAKANPTVRPVDKRKLKYRPKPIKAKIGSVTIPDTQTDTEMISKSVIKEPTDHVEIQYLLLKLGSDMGFDVWVARNDKGKKYNGKKFSELKRLKQELPLQFDDATNKTIELIDVLWLQGNAIVSAFEIESTTSIYSGLLRMGDLIAMQPNLNIPLYLVAPDARREKVMTEVNRPTFSRLSPPLAEVCSYISFSELRENIEKVASIIRYIKPEFLEEFSETCVLEDA
ncbi:hypothetical protein [Desulfobacula sp.]|uniref:hypothetical protein n=1 Tax=Desulfobacula sp. TaxID=2593537 RepID=UPI0025B95457|nr:hypothetical protein [Desulfobacula sp.]MBC2703609.1 hypothetical protein [Desulfobacula sp.]